MPNQLKVVQVKVEGNALMVPNEVINHGHQLIVWQLVDPVEGTGGELEHQWSPSSGPPPGIFGAYASHGQDFGTIDDNNLDDQKKDKKGTWTYTLTLTTSTNTYSTTFSPMGNPNIKNN